MEKLLIDLFKNGKYHEEDHLYSIENEEFSIFVYEEQLKYTVISIFSKNLSNKQYTEIIKNTNLLDKMLNL